ncbi:hypothetical protein EVAR_48509_1 [Eumeta japonica]|uniref:Uncharacterized protein n=1 Tax=Eumeta variegata TaxID=151549 RepID=A0A4C1Z6U0_EUMVA|nr:hypothetical protein EVAR_48509_1 [Eumeta japonica]
MADDKKRRQPRPRPARARGPPRALCRARSARAPRPAPRPRPGRRITVMTFQPDTCRPLDHADALTSTPIRFCNCYSWYSLGHVTRNEPLCRRRGDTHPSVSYGTFSRWKNFSFPTLDKKYWADGNCNRAGAVRSAGGRGAAARARGAGRGGERWQVYARHKQQFISGWQRTRVLGADLIAQHRFRHAHSPHARLYVRPRNSARPVETSRQP